MELKKLPENASKSGTTWRLAMEIMMFEWEKSGVNWETKTALKVFLIAADKIPRGRAYNYNYIHKNDIFLKI